MAGEQWDIASKVVLITGANSGIGRETTRVLTRMGAHVVMVCRDEGRTEEAKDDIRCTTGCEDLEHIIADLSSLSQVRALAREYLSRHDRLDVLLNNAVIIPHERQVSQDGHELQLAVNHLAPFLLTNLLLDVLKSSAPSRIVNVSSGIHHRGRIDLDDLQAERGYRPMQRYGTTKLANILFTRGLARRLEGTGVTANALSPGFISTNLSRDFGNFSKRMVKLMAGKVEKGARTPVMVVTSPDLSDVSGRYFRNMAERRPSERALDDAMGERLWEVSERLTGISNGIGGLTSGA
jgi:retinol dehydrogenase-12